MVTRSWKSQFAVSDGSVDARIEPPDCATVLRSGISLTELKLFEAKYFLTLLEKYARHEGLCLFHLDAFLTALRSVTFVLQKEGARVTKFAAWYAEEQARLGADPVFRLLKNLRNQSEKEGLSAPRVRQRTVVRRHLDGTESARLELATILFENGVQLDRPIEQLGRACGALASLIERAKQAGVLPLGPDRHVRFEIEFLRETEPAVWEHFDP